MDIAFVDFERRLITVYYPRLLQNVQGLESTGNYSQVKIIKSSSELSLETLL